MPSLLSQTDQWGAFIFFAAFNCISLAFVFFMVPEIAGLGVEEIDGLFRGPWFSAYKAFRSPGTINGLETGDKIV